MLSGVGLHGLIAAWRFRSIFLCPFLLVWKVPVIAPNLALVLVSVEGRAGGS